MPIIMFVAPLSSAAGLTRLYRVKWSRVDRVFPRYQFQPTGRRHFDKRGFAIAEIPQLAFTFSPSGPVTQA